MTGMITALRVYRGCERARASVLCVCHHCAYIIIKQCDDDDVRVISESVMSDDVRVSRACTPSPKHLISLDENAYEL